MSEPTRDSLAMYVESAHHSEGDAAFLREMLAGFDALTQRAEAAEAENERLRKAWQSADTTAQALSMNAGYIDVDGLRVGVNMVRSWLERMRVFEEENETLRAERDALRKDAARYRWLRDIRSNVMEVCMRPTDEYGSEMLAGDSLDDAIDAALAVQPTTTHSCGANGFDVMLGDVCDACTTRQS